MAVTNKGISKAVREAFINGTHEPEAMLVKLAHLNTDENRKGYLQNLTKALREKYGMDTKRDVRFGKSRKKTGAKKPTHKQLALNFAKHVHPNGSFSPEVLTERPSVETRNNLHKLLERSLPSIGMGKSEVFVNPVTGHDLADAMRKHDMTSIVEIRKRVYAERISDEDRIVEEYVKLDDDHKALQFKYDDLEDSVGELKREIARLQVIITYLEGKK